MIQKFKQILTWLGILLPEQVKALPTPWQILQDKLQGLTEATEKQRISREATQASQARLEELKKNLVETDFDKITCELELQFHTAENEDDKSKVLNDIVNSLKLIKRPAIEALADIDFYLRSFEESITISEAQGIYKFQISENDKWILLPFLTSFEKQLGKKNAAKKSLEKFVKEIPLLSVVEFSKRVPFRPISFLEINELAENKQISCVMTEEKYFLYLFEG